MHTLDLQCNIDFSKLGEKKKKQPPKALGSRIKKNKNKPPNTHNSHNYICRKTAASCLGGFHARRKTDLSD